MIPVKTILFLDSSLYGGIETHIVELVQLLDSNNINVEVLFYQNHGNKQLYENLDSVNCKYGFLDGSVSSLYNFIKNQRVPLCIHTHGYKAGIIGRITCKILQVNCVSTFHAGEAGTGLVYLYNVIDKLTSYLSTNFVVSKKLLKQVHKATILNNFVRISHYPKSTKSQSLRVAFVGRLSHEKGPDNFIELATCFKKNRNISFHLYGDGPMKQTLQQYLPENVTLHGHQTNNDFWNNVDLLVISSRAEGLPMVLLEAMAREKCVVSFDVGSVSSVIKNNVNGFICSKNTIESLQALINAWSDCKNKDEVTTSAHHTIVKYFSGKKELEVLKAAYNNKLFN